MEQRSVVKLLIFSIITFGIYLLFWFVWTARELRAQGQEVPTSWLIIIPFANLYFMWKHFEASEKATHGSVNGVLYFLLAFFISPILSAALAQNEFNKLGGAPTPGGMPAQPGMPAAPAGPEQAPANPAPAPSEAPMAAAPVADAPTPPSPEPVSAPEQVAEAPAPAPAPQPEAPAAPSEDPNQQQPPATPPTA